MPLEPSVITKITDYCQRDIGKYYQDYVDKFEFISDIGLRQKLGQEFYIARYMAKFQEAMNFDEKSYQLLGYLKFQIVQYAGIYEAVISYLLKNNFSTDSRVKNLGKRSEYKKVDALSNSTKILHTGEQVYICKKSEVKEDWQYVKFEDKLKVAKQIGFIKQEVAEKILSTYKLRHSVHVEKALKSEIIFELEQAKIAYETIFVFLSQIKDFLSISPKGSSASTNVRP